MKLKIMIVEDSDILAEQLGSLIGRYNTNDDEKVVIKMVKDGLSFISQMRQFKPHIVFLDKELELNTDGLEALQVLRNMTPPINDAEIVLLTADDNYRTMAISKILMVKKVILKHDEITNQVEEYLNNFLVEHPEFIEA